MPDTEGLVFDASVLIDYVSQDPSSLGLIARHIAPVVIPYLVLAEVHALDETLAGDLGLTLVESSDEHRAEALTRPRRLSFVDYVCFVTARDAGLVCVTNDGALRAHCEEHGVPTLRGFRPLLSLVEVGRVTALRSLRIVRAVERENGYITRAVVASFARQLWDLRRERSVRDQVMWRPASPEGGVPAPMSERNGRRVHRRSEIRVRRGSSYET